MGDRRARLFLLAGSLALALLGQYYFARKPEYFWDAIIFYALAVLLFLLVARGPHRPRSTDGAPARLSDHYVLLRVFLAGSSLALALAVILELAGPRRGDWPLFWAWLASMALYLLACARRPVRLAGHLRQLVANNSQEWGAVELLLAVAFLLRGWHIVSIPATISGDEGAFGVWARDVLAGRWTSIFSVGHLSMPSLYIFWQAAWLKLAGDGPLGLRLPWAVVGSLSVLGSYLLVRRLFDRWLALMAAFLLATYYYHIHYSRLGLNNIADPFFMAWSLYFLVLGWQSGRRWAWAACGLVAGLAFYFYPGSRQVPVILLAIVAWAALTERDFVSRHGRSLLVAAGACAVAAGPMVHFAFQHPDDFNARLNQIGILQSGWLARTAAASGRSQLSLIGDQVRQSFLAFNLYLDDTDFFRPAVPLLGFAASVFFVLGAALSVAGPRERPAGAPDAGETGARAGRPPWRYALFVIWFALTLILGGVLTQSPPSSQRLLSSSVPALFFVALAIRTLTGLLSELLRWPRAVRWLVAAGLVVGLAGGSLRYYFGPYQESRVYGGYNGEVATHVGYYLRDLAQRAGPGEPGWQEYWFGAPRMWGNFGAITFLAGPVRIYDVQQPLSGPPTFVDPRFKAVFVFLPERLGELQQVRRIYPQGVREDFYRADDPQGPLLFVAYRVDQP